MICIALVYVIDCYIVREQHVLIRSLSIFFVCVIVAACKVYYCYIRKTRRENCKSTAKHNVYDEDYYRVHRCQTHLSRDYEHSKEVINKLKAENDDLRKQLKENVSHIARMTRRLSSKRIELARLNQANERKDSEIKMHEETAKIQGLELQQLQEQLATREKEVTSLNNELSTKQTELQEVHEKLATHQKELTTLANQMIHKEQELEHCQEILATVLEQVKKKKKTSRSSTQQPTLQRPVAMETIGHDTTMACSTDETGFMSDNQVVPDTHQTTFNYPITCSSRAVDTTLPFQQYANGM